MGKLFSGISHFIAKRPVLSMFIVLVLCCLVFGPSTVGATLGQGAHTAVAYSLAFGQGLVRAVAH